MSDQDVVEVSTVVPGATSPPTRDLLTLLDESEVARARQMPDRDGRILFVTARAALRVTLGRLLGIAPRDVSIDTGQNGKPQLTDAAIGFNVSHTEGLIVVAVRAAGQVGVDVESTRRPPPRPGLVRRTLTTAEHRTLAALPPGAGQRAFFQAWSRKEAYAKGLGIGIGIDFRTIEVGWHAPVSAGKPPWEVRSLLLAAPHVGAVAAPGCDWLLSVGAHSW